MEALKPEVVELLTQVEEKYQRPLRTTTDFEEFSLYLERNSKLRVSVSTLKRLWGYVGDQHTPRQHTLDTLAVYLGHPHFAGFCQWMKTSPAYNSSFFSAKHIDCSLLTTGQQIEIGWAPNRRLILNCIGSQLFEVTAATASKLMVGDRFPISYIFRNFPLYLPWVERGDRRLPPFMAGRNGGITVAEIIR